MNDEVVRSLEHEFSEKIVILFFLPQFDYIKLNRFSQRLINSIRRRLPRKDISLTLGRIS